MHDTTPRLMADLTGARVLPIQVAPNGCDDCSVEPGETHRYDACPGNRVHDAGGAKFTSATGQQPWYFTFGSGQQHDGKYVVIPGSYDEARDVMLAHFGNAWSFQYASAERAGVEEFGLVELPRAEWPAPAENNLPTDGTR